MADITLTIPSADVENVLREMVRNQLRGERSESAMALRQIVVSEVQRYITSPDIRTQVSEEIRRIGPAVIAEETAEAYRAAIKQQIRTLKQQGLFAAAAKEDGQLVLAQAGASAAGEGA